MTRLGPRPDCFSGRDHGRLRWGQRRGCDSATSGHHDAREGGGDAGAGGPVGSHRESPPLGLCALEQPNPTVGRALHPRPRARVVARRGAEPAKPRYTGAHAREPARDSLAPSRPFIRARDGDRARSPARAALAAQRAPSWSGRDAERARALRTPTVGPERSVRRLESRAPAVRTRSFVLVAIAVVVLVCAAPAPADSGSPPPIQIGISSQQAGPSRATVRARIASGTPSRAGRANPQLARLPAWSASHRREARSTTCPTTTLIPRSQRTRHLLRIRSRLAPAASGTRSGRAASASTRRTPSFPATRSWVLAALPVVRRSIPRRSPPRSRSG